MLIKERRKVATETIFQLATAQDSLEWLYEFTLTKKVEEVINELSKKYTKGPKPRKMRVPLQIKPQGEKR